MADHPRSVLRIREGITIIDIGTLLFRAVCFDPTDDIVHLVYADYLDEQGQADRAEFIRVQCELARRATAAVQS